MRGPWDPAELRARVADARVMLVFTPELCTERDPLDVLEATLAGVDVVQVRPKTVGDTARTAVTEARAALDWSRQVLEVVGDRELPVIVNDRVDVAHALTREGLAGVHVGADDTPPAVAREVLGPDPLIGLSTHTVAEVVLAGEESVDYIGYGPIFATATKGYARGLGPEEAWVANSAAPCPLFAIGGIDLTNADSLADVGRAAVSSVILCADDPAAAATALRGLLNEEG
ncbi:MAG: thiamine phosphate synthase [bacterium]|nr:thiamine phosphate synthase [bacterium]